MSINTTPICPRLHMTSFEMKKTIHTHPKGYKRLYGSPDSLEKNCPYITRSTDPNGLQTTITCFPPEAIIIKKGLDSLGKYYLFDNEEHVFHFYPERCIHNLHEVIFGDRKQKPKYDIDGYPDAKSLDLIIETIRWYFHMDLDLPDANIMIMNGSRPDKNSAHIVISNYLFADNLDALTIYREIAARLVELGLDKFFDNVNKSTQNFRTPLSSKNGAIMMVPECYTRSMGMITGNENLPVIKVDVRQPISAPNMSATDEDINNLLDELGSLIADWDYHVYEAPNVFFKRRIPRSTFCPYCNTTHDRENFLKAVMLKDRILFGCWKCKDRRQMQIIKKISTPTWNESAQKIINMSNPPTDVNITHPIICTSLDAILVPILPDYRTLYNLWDRYRKNYSITRQNQFARKYLQVCSCH